MKDCVVKHAPAIELWNSWADAENKIPNVPETPNTDAAIAEFRAQGVERFGRETIKIGEEEGDSDIVFAGKQALLFAQQLRAEASK